jgi:hypothetical protein
MNMDIIEWVKLLNLLLCVFQFYKFIIGTKRWMKALSYNVKSIHDLSPQKNTPQKKWYERLQVPL